MRGGDQEIRDDLVLDGVDGVAIVKELVDDDHLSVLELGGIEDTVCRQTTIKRRSNDDQTTIKRDEGVESEIDAM